MARTHADCLIPEYKGEYMWRPMKKKTQNKERAKGTWFSGVLSSQMTHGCQHDKRESVLVAVVWFDVGAAHRKPSQWDSLQKSRFHMIKRD